MNIAQQHRIISFETPADFGRETAPAWRSEALSRIRGEHVYCQVDMSKTSQMDSVGLATLLSIREAVAGRDGHVRLINPCPSVTQLLELTRMHRLFEIATLPFGEPDTDQRPILVIEDEPHIRAVTEIVMKPLGRPVISAGDGGEGILAARKHHPVVILLDYLMPVMDGKETLRRLKADPETKDIPVIVISANEKLSRELLENFSGAAAFVAKPFSPAGLRGEVHRLIQEHAEVRHG